MDKGTEVVQNSGTGAVIGFLLGGPAGALIGLGLGAATSADAEPTQEELDFQAAVEKRVDEILIEQAAQAQLGGTHQ
jgi:hypothetical protein